MKLQLVQGPEGAPNSSFGLYSQDGKCYEFIESDWDWAGMAATLGWEACPCGATDGTVDCEHKKTTDMLSAAFDYLEARDGQWFSLSDYAEEETT